MSNIVLYCMISFLIGSLVAYFALDKEIKDVTDLFVATNPKKDIQIDYIERYDEKLGEGECTLFNSVDKEYDMSIILVSHDLELANQYADRVILLDKEVIKEGTPQEVFESLEFKNRFGEL